MRSPVSDWYERRHQKLWNSVNILKLVKSRLLPVRHRFHTVNNVSISIGMDQNALNNFQIASVLNTKTQKIQKIHTITIIMIRRLSRWSESSIDLSHFCFHLQGSDKWYGYQAHKSILKESIRESENCKNLIKDWTHMIFRM